MSSAPEAETPAADSGPARCRTCGIELSKKPRTCDELGHVQKGLGAMPGFGWFDLLKVYGHCPEAAKAGIGYTRKGQELDKILFGRDLPPRN